MIDLHLHLDGSLSKEDFLYLAKKENIDLPSDFPSCIYVPDDCPSLEDYLKRFELPLSFLQSKENLEYAIKSLVDRLYNLGYIYVEIRFAPQLHLQKGLTQEEVVATVIDGLKKALENKVDFNANLILCLMRQADESINRETVEVANKFKNNKVVAIDLAGPEALHPSTYYQNCFRLAKSYGLNIIIHAGEATGSDEIMRAIDMGAKRIGHGVHLSLDPQTINRVVTNGITFEFCPTSNLQTKSLKTYNDVPILDFLKYGIFITINSDNMTVSNTDVIQEFRHLMKIHHFEKHIIYQLLYTSIMASFISSDEKIKFINVLIQKIDSFYARII